MNDGARGRRRRRLFTRSERCGHEGSQRAEKDDTVHDRSGEAGVHMLPEADRSRHTRRYAELDVADQRFRRRQMPIERHRHRGELC
jgi:hypothetical protein